MKYSFKLFYGTLLFEKECIVRTMPIPVVCGKLTGSMAAPIYGKTMIIRRFINSNKIFARKFNSNQMGVVYKIQKLYLKQVPK